MVEGGVWYELGHASTVGSAAAAETGMRQMGWSSCACHEQKVGDQTATSSCGQSMRVLRIQMICCDGLQQQPALVD